MFRMGRVFGVFRMAWCGGRRRVAFFLGVAGGGGGVRLFGVRRGRFLAVSGAGRLLSRVTGDVGSFGR
jgi:hypothetical protein